MHPNKAIVSFWIIFALAFSTRGAVVTEAAALPEPVRWVVMPSPTQEDLFAVDMVSDTNGWIAGARGTLLRFDGANWIPHALPVTLTLTALSMASSADGWAVGQDATQTRILRWNGSVWNDVATGPDLSQPALTAVSAAPTGAVWVTGGTTYSFDGSPCGPTNLSCPYDGAYSWPSYWNGATFTGTNADGFYLSTIEAYSATLVFAAGFDGHIRAQPYAEVIARWNGTGWQDEYMPRDAGPVNDLFIRTPSDGWAVGRDDILHYNGADWSRAPHAATPALHGVETTALDEGWAVGSAGTIVYWDGSAWQSQASPVTTNLTSLSLTAANRGWAVGSGGVILRLTTFSHNAYFPAILR